ncbi:MAG: polyisoprenoid-binding protein [Micromonosporaceae bacterium]|nr:polyisoprenoid-binding protein [Micromonosporaceae bacterium]
MTAPTVTLPGQTAGIWAIDPGHSEVSFTVRHLMSKVRGTFTDFSGEVVVADDLRRSTAHAQIAIASVDTRNEQRDTHLRSPEILHAERHPHMTFQVTGVRDDGGDYVVAGDLTIAGVTRPVELAVEFLGVDADPWGGIRAGFCATTQISRKNFGIDFNIPLEGDKLLLGDKIDIQLEIQAVRQN